MINENMIAKANTYIPLKAKLEFADYVAPRCIDKIAINISENDSITGVLPNMYQENTGLKSRYLLGALLVMYLKQNIEVTEEDEYLITEACYDEWCAKHLLNRIERFKANTALRDRVFDIMQDYRDLEKRINSAIYSYLRVQNDIIVRTKLLINMSIDPENVKNMLSEIDKIKDTLESRNKELGGE